MSETLYLATIVCASLAFLGFLCLRSKDSIKDILHVLPLRKQPSPMPDSDYANPIKDLEHRLDMAENARKWYQECINNRQAEVPLALRILLKHSVQAIARFAVQEVRDGRVSKRPESQCARVESLMESCFLALRENGASEETAESTVKDGITFILYSFEMSSTVLPEGIISNPAEQYFDVRDNRL